MTGLRVGMFLRSLFLQSGYADDSRQALGFAWALDPALASAFAGDPSGLAAARARHLGPFNTNPCAVGIILGSTACLEARAAGAPEKVARVLALKSAAAASLAGAADPFFWGSLRPLAAAGAVFFALLFRLFHLDHPLFWGAVAGLAAFNVPALAARWWGVSSGLARGEGALVAVSRWPVQAWISRCRWAAIVFLVAAAALADAAGFPTPPLFAAGAFVAGAALSRVLGGPLRLVAGAGLLGAAAAAGGWAL